MEDEIRKKMSCVITKCKNKIVKIQHCDQTWNSLTGCSKQLIIVIIAYQKVKISGYS